MYAVNFIATIITILRTSMHYALYRSVGKGIYGVFPGLAGGALDPTFILCFFYLGSKFIRTILNESDT